MVRFAGLLKREWHEHRGAFTWVPGALLLLVLLAGLSAVSFNRTVSLDVAQDETVEIEGQLSERDQEDLSILEVGAAMLLDVAGSTDAELEKKMSALLDGVAVPFHLLFVLVAFFALIACLYDERKDQTVLFWKSMPVSDLETVLSKLVFIIWFAPLVTIAAIVAAQLFVVVLSAMFVEDGMGARVWSASEIWLRPIGLVLRYLLLGLWALPFCGWLMLVSAASSRLPFLWALGIPWFLFVLESTVFGSEHLVGLVTSHFKTLASSPFVGGAGIAGQFELLGSAGYWVGIAVGLALLAAAVYFRGRNNEA